MQIFPGELLNGGGGMPRETCLAAKFLDFLEKLDDRIRVLRHPIRLRIH